MNYNLFDFANFSAEQEFYKKEQEQKPKRNYSWLKPTSATIGGAVLAAGLTNSGLDKYRENLENKVNKYGDRYDNILRTKLEKRRVIPEKISDKMSRKLLDLEHKRWLLRDKFIDVLEKKPKLLALAAVGGAGLGYGAYKLGQNRLNALKEKNKKQTVPKYRMWN